MHAPPDPDQEKAPASVSALNGGKKLTGGNARRIQNKGQSVKPWRWGWPTWVSWLYRNGRGVRR